MGELPTALSLAKITLGLIVVLFVGYALPYYFVQRALRAHYRDRMGTKGYWGRAYYKWIIKYRIFYTDEFGNDLLVSALAGAGSGIAFSLVSDVLLAGLLREYLFFELFLPPFLATAVLLFVSIQVDRVQFIDDEIRVRKKQVSDFDNLSNIEEITLNQKRLRYVRRIIASPYLQYGEKD